MVNTEEKDYFEWFKCRTATKLPGLFVLAFWDTLVFQASVDEPAVLHAALALGAVHKSEILLGNRLGSCDSFLNEQERFMLQHYSKAISCLQPRCSARNRASVRVALVTCVMFICLELLRGHYQMAQTHLRNGIKLLSESRACSDVTGSHIPTIQLSCDPVDDHIAEALSSLHVRAALLNTAEQGSYLGPEPFETVLSRPTFSSFTQAKLHLDRLLQTIFILNTQCHQSDLLDSPTSLSTLLTRQQHILASLSSWLSTFTVSKPTLTARNLPSSTFAYALLQNHHTMAHIMASACLPFSPPNESRFDAHIPAFTSIIAHSLTLWEVISTARTRKSLSGHLLDGNTKGDAIVEIGWIPPLYYTAIKCRVHRIRLHAIRLLELSPHREGFWSASIAATVARQVMSLEEGDLFTHMLHREDDAFDVFRSVPEEEDVRRLPALPEERRIREVEVVLPDDPAGKVTLLCRRYKEAGAGAGAWEVLGKEFDVRSGRWREAAR